AALALADGVEQIQDAASEVFLGRFHLEAALRIKRSEVIEENLVARDLGVLKVHGFDFDQREVALAVLGRPDLSGDSVAGAQVELADLRRRDVDVVWAGEVVVLRRAEEAEAVRKALEDAFRKDETALFGLRAENLENELLFAHTAGAGDVELLGDLGEV